MTWVSYSAFRKGHLVFSPELATPFRNIWQQYEKYCDQYGFEKCPIEEFIDYLLIEDGVSFRTGGQGRLRRMATGVAYVASNDDRLGDYGYAADILYNSNRRRSV